MTLSNVNNSVAALSQMLSALSSSMYVRVCHTFPLSFYCVQVCMYVCVTLPSFFLLCSSMYVRVCHTFPLFFLLCHDFLSMRDLMYQGLQGLQIKPSVKTCDC
jgi:hypothetical protein